MKKRILLAVVAVFLIVSMGCVKPPPTVTPDEFAALKTTVEERGAVIESLRVGKADKAATDAVATRVTTLEGRANTYTKAELYTQAEVRALIQALKDDQSWITGYTTTSAAGTTVGEWGELLDTDGDLQLWLERVSGAASDELLTKMGTNEGRFDLVVVNLDAEDSHDFKISFRFDPDRAVTLEYIPDVPTPIPPATDDCDPMDDTKTTMSGTGGLTFVVDRAGNNRHSLSPLVVYQSNTARILKGDVEDHTVWLYIDQVTNAYVEWEWDITIDDKD